jgi:succinate-semialdehyde dehydrogenase
MFELQMQYQRELAEVITMEMGKPIAESMGEIAYGASFFEWFSEQARRINGEILQSPFPDKVMMYTREPIGPVGIMVPWNFPNAMITRKLAAALACGCTAIIRPSEESPFSALALGKIAEEAGIPPGVVNVVTSRRQHATAITKSICQSPDIAAISFTGSTSVGKMLLDWGASTVKRICLELGGNAPFIVFDSADVDRAVDGCMASKFRNTGQTCVCANRIFVQSGIHDEFVKKLAATMASQLKSGNTLDQAVTVGPLVNERAVEKVKDHVDDAVSKGGKVITGGKHVGGYNFEPTLITNVSKDMKLCSEETFGPLAGVVKFDSEEEVLELANSVRVGLAGYFYSGNIAQIWRVARRLQVGMVGVNEGIISCSEAPFGGVKESGLGREGSHLGIDEFVNIKYICLGGMKV